MTRKKEYVPTNETYKIKDINDIIQFISSDNLDLFLTDFRSTLEGIIEIKELVLKSGLSEDVPGLLQIDNIEWIDDGKHDNDQLKISIRVDDEDLK